MKKYDCYNKITLDGHVVHIGHPGWDGVDQKDIQHIAHMLRCGIYKGITVNSWVWAVDSIVFKNDDFGSGVLTFK